MSRETEAVKQWLQDVVIGLNLCPFAAWPWNKGLIRIESTEAESESDLLVKLHDECRLLENSSADELETTLLVTPKMLADFYDYNQFLDSVDQLLVEYQWEGIFQIASFHPDYCFGGTQPEDAENLTNRSPYPVLHIIREESLEKAVEQHPDPDGIPDRNIEAMNKLDDTEKQKLFPYLFTAQPGR
ncbi:DUF1415 domain-containing protein [Endozoicomonas sp. OPT23]|uniref:DUF1415 domain-containing protein n=1 Tax=Endozoicomonas sp. OPT23 TaxID=2072845 RepID=UPI00129A5285|nr:DUF1415 domain-containing protein [Endozoicomonas sp. OPT23]MRI32621.1 DUF1415 domain-containing protein [Endozoicomonas sp. OPT23]